jgi:predicted nucleic acid-binding protein
MLLDSNIIIYSAKREHAELRHFLNENPYSVSAVSRIKVLGYHLLTEKQREYLEKFFDAASVLTISDSVVTHAVQLRQEKRMSLGDAIVARHGFGASAQARDKERPRFRLDSRIESY